MAPGAKTLVCIPTYNEAENVELIVPAVLQALPEGHVLIIDDNSPDGTGALADALAAAEERVFVLHRQAKEGLGRAYLAAFDWALQRDYAKVFEFDADFSHDPSYLPHFVELLDQHDVVVGSRRIQGGGVEDWGALRRLVSWGGSLYARVVLSVDVRDLTGGFNGFTRKVLETIDLAGVRSTGYAFQVELKYRAVEAGFDVVESAIIFPDRVRGVSKMTPGIVREAMLQVIRLRLGR